MLQDWGSGGQLSPGELLILEVSDSLTSRHPSRSTAPFQIPSV